MLQALYVIASEAKQSSPMKHRVNKQRLDKLLVDLGYFESREKAVTCIMSNGVKLSGKLITKPGYQINLEQFYKDYEADSSCIEVNDRMLEYVSRGAYKLQAADRAFGLDFQSKIILDIGASTGGFTEYALKQEAVKVIALDVGKAQLHYKLRNDPRVINLEELNFRLVDSDFLFSILKTNNLAENKIAMIVIDVSFISLIVILEKIKELFLKQQAFDSNLEIIALIKPQFEAGKEIMDKCEGVIRDEKIRQNVLESTLTKIQNLDFIQKGLIESPIQGAKGNIEYLLYLSC